MDYVLATSGGATVSVTGETVFDTGSAAEIVNVNFYLEAAPSDDVNNGRLDLVSASAPILTLTVHTRGSIVTPGSTLETSLGQVPLSSGGVLLTGDATVLTEDLFIPL